ncbi:growth hormone releasing hormone receptor 2 isoform X2 [Alosa sapidissima]|uniref:growth hormone releasing hormone receptor 2 isoform X2 n=1 Tax=Alosa sapidissima TaxID=34773 RepID=UPI001C093264|nr:growth hormone releasing hormone receptor 2 isoform X2 [Alosa sapidissima]
MTTSAEWFMQRDREREKREICLVPPWSGRPERCATASAVGASESTQVSSTHAECSIIHHLQKQENECMLEMNKHRGQHPSSSNRTAGCAIEWDGVSCWPWALVGETVSASCPLPLQHHNLPHVLIWRNCTSQGWSKPSVSYYRACFHDESSIQEDDTADQQEYFALVKLMYSVGYGVSLGSLCVAVLIFLTFRRLLCTRTYIHLNLFSTFILRGVAVFVKDAVLFEDKTLDHCTVSTVGCKAAVTFFQYCVLANFFWLLVEGLFLQTLLIFSFANKRTFFWWYTFIGWGTPSVTIVIWTLLQSQYNNLGCWDDLDSALWWIIKTPILISVFVNFIVFVNISRIIVMKTKTPDSSGGDKPLCRRLAKSTLLLIPLFGVHYIVFALFPEHVGIKARLLFELVLGSFQGFIVALLYCFLNAEVQNEIRKAVSRCRTQTEGNNFNMVVTQDFTA